MPILQIDRLVTLDTPLGKDVLLVETLEGTESVSGLFRFNLVLVSERRNIALADLVSQRVGIAIELANRKYRYINGFVSRFTQGDVDSRVSHYYAEVVPWLWFLTRTTDCRIFQRKTVPDIVRQIFEDLGVTDFRFQLQGNFEPREYCVQYRETDFHFVSRLLEEEGIYYFFEHTPDKHTLILANHPGAHPPCPNQARARYGYALGGRQDEDLITRWHLEQEVIPGKYTLTDYYFQTPSNNLEVSSPSAVNSGRNGKLEVYDYPGPYAKRFDGDDKAPSVRPDGERTAKLWMQGDEAFHKVASGAGGCRAFTPGYRFDLVEHRRADLNGPYVLTQVSHSATNNLGDGEGASYDNTFTAVPYSVPVRPARVTPRPIVHGSQTAVVVGLPGEEIDTDKYGRVKVQFHWDREGRRDHNSSCWIRVGTPWAGRQWGMVHIPRIGQEVIVDFLEGDPDRPIIVGSVYNAEHMPPYELPANKTQSGVKSRSSLDGTPENFNEICFEDKKGEEFIYIRAEKDLIQAVENDEYRWVGRDRTTTIDRDDTTHIQRDRTETVDRDDRLTVGHDRIEKVGRHQTVGVEGNRGETVSGDEDVTIKGNQKLTVAGDQTISVAGKRSVTVGGNDTLSVGGVRSVTAGDAIVLSTGGAAIILKSDGTILIKGTDITILGSGTITARAGGTMTLKAAVIKEN